MWLDQGLNARDYEKHGETLAIFSLGAPFALLNVTTRLLTPLYPLLLTLLALVIDSPFLHSVAHYTRLVIPWQVLYLSLQPPLWKRSLSIVSSS
jgi:hypothetical protein